MPRLWWPACCWRRSVSRRPLRHMVVYSQLDDAQSASGIINPRRSSRLRPRQRLWPRQRLRPTAMPTVCPTPRALSDNDDNDDRLRPCHDANLRRKAAPRKVQLPATKQISVRVRNDGTHADTIGVYADIIPPGGVTNPYGCTPSGRIIQTTVSLSPGQETPPSAQHKCSTAPTRRGSE